MAGDNKPITHIINEELDQIDAFFRGQFYIVQPKKHGHRIGLDAMLIASCVPDNFTGHIADFGSGAGGAGLAAISRSNLSDVKLIENSPYMLQYTYKTMALAENLHLKHRVTIINANLEASGKQRESDGILPNYFDFVVMNPPYNDPKTRKSSDILKATAHVSRNGLLEKWLKAAACCLKSHGKIALITRPDNINETLNAMHNRFGKIIIYPIHANPSKDAMRLVFIAEKNSSTKLTIKQPINIRIFNQISNELILNPKIDKICNGMATIYD